MKYLALHGEVGFIDDKTPRKCTADWLERVNPEVFEALKLNCSDNGEEISVVLNNVMESSVKLNLKSFELLTREIDERQLATLGDFLKTQKNLTKLMLGYKPIWVGGAAFNPDSLKPVFEVLPKLTELWYGDLESLKQGEDTRRRIIDKFPNYNENPKKVYVSDGKVFAVYYCDECGGMHGDSDTEILESDLDEDCNAPEQSSDENSE